MTMRDGLNGPCTFVCVNRIIGLMIIIRPRRPCKRVYGRDSSTALLCPKFRIEIKGRRRRRILRKTHPFYDYAALSTP